MRRRPPIDRVGTELCPATAAASSPSRLGFVLRVALGVLVVVSVPRPAGAQPEPSSPSTIDSQHPRAVYARDDQLVLRDLATQEEQVLVTLEGTITNVVRDGTGRFHFSLEGALYRHWRPGEAEPSAYAPIERITGHDEEYESDFAEQLLGVRMSTQGEPFVLSQVWYDEGSWPEREFVHVLDPATNSSRRFPSRSDHYSGLSLGTCGPARYEYDIIEGERHDENRLVQVDSQGERRTIADADYYEEEGSTRACTAAADLVDIAEGGTSAWSMELFVVYDDGRVVSVGSFEGDRYESYYWDVPGGWTEDRRYLTLKRSGCSWCDPPQAGGWLYTDLVEAPILLPAHQETEPIYIPAGRPLEEAPPLPTPPQASETVARIDGVPFNLGLTPEDLRAHQAACEAAGSTRCGAARFEREQPAIRVHLATFYLDRNEVTRSQYEACVTAGECEPIDESQCQIFDGESWDEGRTLPEAALHPDAPRTCVTRTEASAYCRWAGGRLPSEAEWELAARGVDARIFAGAGPFEATHYNFLGTRDPPSVVDVNSLPQSRTPEGVFNLSGNAYEWVAGGACSYADFNAITMGPDPDCSQTETPRQGVIRGGSFASDAGGIRTTYRRFVDRDARLDTNGFRCAYTTPPSP